ncbi:hypothetical protein LWM68_42860 [Niabella sp. W65]|nr:hypothetical protein [Niabella sp. W65]MCH7368886.1 hypothetical protein [Niabella sp. W65]ULT44456.1 hypothetical protein KRR40_14555 [Niabella sp. I65]
MHKVAFSLVEGLLNAQKNAQHQSALLAESSATDPQRFAGLKPVDVVLTPIPERSKRSATCWLALFRRY